MSIQKAQKALSLTTRQRKAIVRPIIEKLLNEGQNISADHYHMKIKLLEHNKITTLDTAKEAINVCKQAIKSQLASSTLTSKQKAEILLVANIQSYKIIKAYIESINNDH